jgi:hypothetical protein
MDTERVDLVRLVSDASGGFGVGHRRMLEAATAAERLIRPAGSSS